MEAFFINADNQTERREWMAESCAIIGLSAKRFPAVLPNTPPFDEAIAKLKECGGATTLTGNALGCFLSHYRLWHQISKGQNDHCLILEDDIIFSRDFSTALESENLLSEAPDLVRLESWQGDVVVARKKHKINHSFYKHQLFDAAGGAAAYILSRRAAEWLTRSVSRYDLPVDLFLFRDYAPVTNNLRVFTLLPCPAIQHDTLHRKTKNRNSPEWNCVGLFPALTSQRRESASQPVIAQIAHVNQSIEPNSNPVADSGQKNHAIKAFETALQHWHNIHKELAKAKKVLFHMLKFRKFAFAGVSGAGPVIPITVPANDLTQT